MKTLRIDYRLHALLLASLALVGCDDTAAGDVDGGALLATGDGPCEASSECSGDVCIALIDGNNPPVYCSESCGDCPDGFVCDTETFALVGQSFCRFGDVVEDSVPPEPPRLPCASDDDCSPGLVCATFMGERDCGLPCEVEDDCTIAASGVTLDLYTCAQDQSPDRERLVCLPDLSCYPDPTSCISF